jgi:hypothetical protein
MVHKKEIKERRRMKNIKKNEKIDRKMSERNIRKNIN